MKIDRWDWDPNMDMVPSEEGEYVRYSDHERAALNGFADMQGYVGVFYELAAMMDMCAQPRSPKEVWETQMRPELQKLIESEARMEKLVPVAHAHMDPATGMHWLQWMGDPAKIPMPLYERPPLGKPIAFIEKWAEWEDDQLVWDVEEESGRMYIPLYAGTPFHEGEPKC